MKCVLCHGETIVIDSRVCGNGKIVRRRRECPTCNIRFTTKELFQGGTVSNVQATRVSDARSTEFE